MTEKEMSEIFSVMLLAYPNAECFKGGKERLLPTVKLWCRCCFDVDFWTAQRAVFELIRECKYPPTIAELIEKAKAVTAEIESRAENVFYIIRMNVDFYGLEQSYEKLPEAAKEVVDCIGGMNKILNEDRTMYRRGEIIHAYALLERKRTAFRVDKRTDSLVAVRAFPDIIKFIPMSMQNRNSINGWLAVENIYHHLNRIIVKITVLHCFDHLRPVCVPVYQIFHD